ncbi:MAG: acyltransferase family protein [Malacoplasma sp.]
MNKRINWIDIGKGIAIILVMFGHCKITPVPIIAELYTFHMPLFFFLSGYVFSIKKNHTFKMFLKHKSKELMLPFLMFNLVLIGYFLYCNPQNIRSMISVQYILGIVIQNRGTPYYVSMWYLTCLFLSQILLYFIVKVSREKKVFIGTLLFISSLVGYYLLNVKKMPLPWHLDIVPTALVFVGIGYIIRNVDNSVFKRIFQMKNILFYLIVNFVTGMINYKQTGYADLYSCNMGNYIYYYIAAITGVFAVVTIVTKISNCKELQYIGKNSLIFYAFQNDITLPGTIRILQAIGFLNGITFLSKSLESVVIVGLACINLAIVAFIINQCFPFLLGKGKVINSETQKQKESYINE